MSGFMVEFDIPSPDTPAFMLKIPLQKMMVDELVAEGKIQSYSLSEDRQKLWMIFSVDTEMEVLEILESFPLRSEMEHQIIPLMFNHLGTIKVPAFSLN